MIKSKSMMGVEEIRRKLAARGDGLPPDTIPLCTERPNLTTRAMRRLVDEVHARGNGKPCPLYAWVMRRGAAYFDGPGQDWTHEELDYAACLDLNRWIKGNR